MNFKTCSAPQGSAEALSRTGLFIKRLTDICLSAVMLISAAPVMAIIALAIKFDSPGRILFQQRRVGQHGEFFEIYKFRTMLTGTPDLPTDEMLKRRSPITRVGRFLRNTSLDEVPQLLNVVRGEMSLVGPRPALYNQTELTARRRACGVLRFPPGITGWAQINGRDELPDDIKVKFDSWYCNNWSLWLDLKILFLTFRAVLSGRGAF
ncbi:MAG: sugar transferase [Candidatus Melainabacteria bacterium]|nr:sugar transferase [Candidatus Melainabacteria bacterium]